MGENVAIERVEHHRSVDAGEHPRLKERDFSATALLRRGAHKLDGPGDGMTLPPEREEGAEGTRGDEVVPAGMANLREGVVLGEDGDPGTNTVADASPERGGETTDPALHGDALTLDGFREPRSGAVLFEAELRVRVDPRRDVAQRGRERVDVARNAVEIEGRHTQASILQSHGLARRCRTPPCRRASLARSRCSSPGRLSVATYPLSRIAPRAAPPRAPRRPRPRTRCPRWPPQQRQRRPPLRLGEGSSASPRRARRWAPTCSSRRSLTMRTTPPR